MFILFDKELLLNLNHVTYIYKSLRACSIFAVINENNHHSNDSKELEEFFDNENERDKRFDELKQLLLKVK